MHIFNMRGTCLQYKPLLYKSNGQEMAMLKNAVNLSKINFQYYNSSYWKPLEELISQNVHYQPFLYISNGQKMAMLKNAVNLSKIIISAL